MPGSPRVERAAQIRIEHPNLSTEEAMKLAGYNSDEARDQRKQSNVRQKTHRLSKGRRRAAPDNIDGERTPQRLRTQYNGADISHPGGLQPVIQEIKTPGSPRVDKAARFKIDNPNLSTEDAMKLAGYTNEEAKDKKRQNNVRQKAHRINVKAASRNDKNAQEIASELKEEMRNLRKQNDVNSNQVIEKVDGLDRKISTVLQAQEQLKQQVQQLMNLISGINHAPQTISQGSQENAPNMPNDEGVGDTVAL